MGYHHHNPRLPKRLCHNRCYQDTSKIDAKRSLIEDITTFVLAGITLIAFLSWNKYFHEKIEREYNNALESYLMFALIITGILVLLFYLKYRYLPELGRSS